jgi:hypothetical protein
MSDRLRARVGYSLRYSWQFWRNVLVRDLADHAPINYARAVFASPEQFLENQLRISRP